MFIEGLSDRDYFFDFWNLFLDHSFDAGFEGESGHRAAFTGSLEANFDHTVFSDLDQLDISTIRLDGRADPVQYFFYFFLVYHFVSYLVCDVQAEAVSTRIEQIHGVAVNRGDLGVDIAAFQIPGIGGGVETEFDRFV